MSRNWKIGIGIGLGLMVLLVACFFVAGGGPPYIPPAPDPTAPGISSVLPTAMSALTPEKLKETVEAALKAGLEPLQTELAAVKGDLTTAKTELAAVKGLVTPPSPASPADPNIPLTIVPVQRQQRWLQAFDGWSDGGAEGLVTAAVAYADGAVDMATVSVITNYDRRGGSLAGAVRFTIRDTRIVGDQLSTTWSCPKDFDLPIRHVLAEQQEENIRVTIYPREGMVVDLLRAVVRPGQIEFYLRRPTGGEWDEHRRVVDAGRVTASAAAAERRLADVYHAQLEAARLVVQIKQVAGQEARIVHLYWSKEVGDYKVAYLDQATDGANTVRGVRWSTKGGPFRFQDSGVDFVSTQDLAPVPTGSKTDVVFVVIPVAPLVGGGS